LKKKLTAVTNQNFGTLMTEIQGHPCGHRQLELQVYCATRPPRPRSAVVRGIEGYPELSRIERFRIEMEHVSPSIKTMMLVHHHRVLVLTCLQ
jgi:hypothetical protein